MDLGAVELPLGVDVGAEQPERDIHALDFLEPAVADKGIRQEPLSLGEICQRGDGVLFRRLERDHIVGTQHSGEPLGQHGRVAAVAALRRHRVGVAYDFRAAGRADGGVQILRLALGPARARRGSVPAARLPVVRRVLRR